MKNSVFLDNNRIIGKFNYQLISQTSRHSLVIIGPLPMSNY